jgi:hypothetical protein
MVPASGLVLKERVSDWSGDEYVHSSGQHVIVYARRGEGSARTR